MPDDADYHCDDWDNPKDYYSVSMVGTGKFVKDIKGAVFEVNGRWYKAEYIQKIAEFMGAFGIEEIKVGHKGDGLIWTAGWVHFMLMRITEPDGNIWRGKVEVETISE